MKRQVKVVMLPTEKASVIHKHNKSGMIIMTTEPTVKNSVYNTTPQNLYFISDDKIKEGDWVFRKGNGSFIEDVVYQIKKGSVEHKDMLSPTYYNTKCKKVIATTNEELGYIGEFGIFNQLPVPSDEFIENFCELDGIWEVAVDYEDDCELSAEEYIWRDTSCAELKVAPDNTI